MIDTDRYATLLGRVMLALIFVWSGVGKLVAPAATIAYIARSGMPLPTIAYAASLCIELGGGLAVAFGFKTKWAAAVLSAFSVVTALAFHSNFSDRNMQIHFMKNIAMAGGFLYLLAFGAGALSLDALLSSRHRTIVT